MSEQTNPAEHTEENTAPTTPVGETSVPTTPIEENTAPVVNGPTSGTVVKSTSSAPGNKQSKQTAAVAQSPTVVLASIIADINANGTPAARNAIAGLNQYMVKMQPGMPMAKEQGASAQALLWRTIQGIIENTNEEFNTVYTALLSIFDQHKDGVFGERYVFRFMDTVALSTDETHAFLAIVNLIKLTAAVKGRKEALRQVDMGRTLGKVFSEQGRQKVLAFYGM